MDIGNLVDLKTVQYDPTNGQLVVKLNTAMVTNRMADIGEQLTHGTSSQDQIPSLIQAIGAHFQTYAKTHGQPGLGNEAGWTYILRTEKGLYTIEGGHEMQGSIAQAHIVLITPVDLNNASLVKKYADDITRNAI